MAHKAPHKKGTEVIDLCPFVSKEDEMNRMMSGLLCLLLCGCQSAAQPDPQPADSPMPAQLVNEQVLHGESGDIHYSYQLP